MSFTDRIDGYCRAFEEYMNKDTIQDLRREIDEMTCLVNGFRSENDRLKEENAKLYLSNEELKRENKQLKKININLDNEISELEKEQDNLKQEYKIAIDENNFFIKENARLEEEVERRGYTVLSAENKCLKEINSNLKVEIERLKKENSDLDKRLKDVEADWAATEYEKTQLEEAFDKIFKQNVDLMNALNNRAETKIYQLSAEDFAKTFKGQWTISIAPDEVSISDFTVNSENDKDRLSYYLTYKDTEYDEPFDKIYKYLKSYQIERVAIAKMLDEIRAEIKSSEFMVKQFEDMMLNENE